MAVQFNVEHTRSSEYRLFPENITIRPDLNGRHELPDIEWLVQDILRQGQIVPVTIRSDGGTPVLTAGFSRWRAISEINKRKLAPVKMQIRCTYMQCSEQEGFLGNISENRFRNNTTILDDAHNIKRLLKQYAMTEEQIAAIYFPTAENAEDKKKALRFVKQRASLASLTKEAEQAVRQGRLKESATVAIAKLSEQQQREVLKNSTGKIKTSAVKPSQKTASVDIKTQIREVIHTGKYKGISKIQEASDDMVQWLTRLIGE